MTKPIESIKDYADNLSVAIQNLDEYEIDKAINIMVDAMEDDRLIFSCGNGGSAAIESHLTCDCMKGVATDTEFRPRIISLSSNVPVMTAIGNDFGYDHTFSGQLFYQARPKDVLIVISSSGNSPNIIEALTEAKRIGMRSIAIIGFDGGKSIDMADCVIHIKSDNYGIVEDASQAIMHFIAQTIRRQYSDKNPEDIRY